MTGQKPDTVGQNDSAYGDRAVTVGDVDFEPGAVGDIQTYRIGARLKISPELTVIAVGERQQNGDSGWYPDQRGPAPDDPVIAGVTQRRGKPEHWH